MSKEVVKENEETKNELVVTNQNLIGSDLSVYNENNMIFEGAVKHTITFASRATAYIALPSSSIKLYDDTGYGEVLEDGWLNNPVVEKVINGVKYYIYTSNSSKLVAWGQDVY